MTALVAPWSTVLWDFDGTLVDSVAGIVAAHQAAMVEVTGERSDERAVRRRIGEPYFLRIAQLVPEHAEQVAAAYVRIMAAQGTRNITPYLEVVDIVGALTDIGVANAIVTSRPRTMVRQVLDEHGLTELFGCLIALDDTNVHKPDPAPLLAALHALDAAPDDAVYIGDACVDMRAARAAAVGAVAVTWGAGLPAELEAEQPDVVATTPVELALALGAVGEAIA